MVGNVRLDPSCGLCTYLSPTGGQHQSMCPSGRLVSIVDSHSVFLELSSGVESVSNKRYCN